MKKKDVARKMLNDQLKTIKEHVEKCDEQLQELHHAADALKNVPNEEREILVPVAKGVFAKAKIAPSCDYIVNVGSGVAVKQTRDNTIKMVEDQITDIKKHKQQLIEKFELIAEHMVEMENALSEE